MVAIAICSASPVLPAGLQHLVRGGPTVTTVGIVDRATALVELTSKHRIDVVVADAPPRGQFADWRGRHSQIALVILVDGADEEESLDALGSGASAILLRSANCDEIAAAIKAASTGLFVLQQDLVQTVLCRTPLAGQLTDDVRARAGLTPRELEVLAAMADGASNKAIARRLGISFHTIKFHVASILAKLDADSRTEAVMKAAQLGIVML